MNYSDTTGDQRAKLYIYLNRRGLLKLICIAVLGTGLLVSGCDHASLDPSQNRNAKENNNMESVSVTSDIRQQIPPLDILQPQELKTATFALG
jgi:hypothetical protein